MTVYRDPTSTSEVHVKQMAWLTAALALTAPEAVVAQAPDLPPAFRGAWDAMMADHRANAETAGIVGASVAFVRDGEVVARDDYGYEDLESGRPVDEGTIFHWASITKTFTGVAVMQLRDHGLLDLDDPIVKYVPELRAVRNPFGAMEDITIGHLLNHSAGFRAPTWPWGGNEEWHPHEPTEWSQLVTMMPYTEILFPPGSRWSYSNPGIVFLGRALERLTGDVFEAYVEKNIFDPLGMPKAYFDGTPWHLLEDRSNNYQVVEGEPVANGLDFNTGITVSNGGLNTTVGEMARWVGFIMNAPGPRRHGHARVLARASVEEMFRGTVTIADSTPLGRSTMGLTFFLYEHEGRLLVGHTGGQKSFVSFILVDPEANVGAIAAFNTAGGDDTAPETGRLSRELQSRVASELFPLFHEGTRATGN